MEKIKYFYQLYYRNLIILGISCLFFGFLSIYLGQDVNWDLRNYHFYNSYAFLNQRLEYDSFAAQIQTFINPIMYIPIYWAIQYIKPIYVSFMIGAIQGLNLFLCYLIAQSVLEKLQIKFSSYLSLSIAIISTCSPLFLSEVGVTMGDNLSSLPVLLGILIIIKQYKQNSNNLSVLMISGFFLGIAAGFKLTNLLYVLATIISLCILSPKNIKSLFSIVLFLLGIILGFILISGYWSLLMIEKYNNPLFPFYNSIFKSPYLTPVSFKDQRWIPDNFIAIFNYPWSWLIGKEPSLSSEQKFRDIRWFFIIVLYIINGLNFLFLKNRKLTINNECQKGFVEHFLLIFTGISFVIWLFMFGYSRYLIPLDLFSGITIFILIYFLKIKINRKLKIFAILLLYSLILFTMQIPSHGRLPSWSNSWFGVEIDAPLKSERMLVVMLSHDPISYVIPFFPKSVRFVRIEGNFEHLIENTLSEKRLHSIIDEYQDNIYALIPSRQNIKDSQEKLRQYNLFVPESSQCFEIKSHFEKLNLCSLER